MRIVRVPVIDGDPIEPSAEIDFHLPGEIARESFEIGHLAGVLGRDDEAEMMPVVLAAIREGRVVSAVTAGIEHHRLLTVTGDAVALQIGKMGGQRRGTEGSSLVTNDARLHHHAPRRTEQAAAAKTDPAASEGRAPVARGALTRRRMRRAVTGFLRRTQHLVDEALRLRRSRAADAARPDA